MKVKELIEHLKFFEHNREVVLQKDPEGNGYSPLYGFWEGAYKAETARSGEAGLEALTQTDIEAGYNEDDVIEDGVKAIFLIPMG